MAGEKFERKGTVPLSFDVCLFDVCLFDVCLFDVFCLYVVDLKKIK